VLTNKSALPAQKSALENKPDNVGKSFLQLPIQDVTFLIYVAGQYEKKSLF
jgi:hypothetical protein